MHTNNKTNSSFFYRLSFKEFNLGYIQTARNFENSLLIERFNLGAQMEADIIPSTSNDTLNPLPRSARLNLTAELFGRSINILEIGGSQEGVNILIEEALASYGLAPKTKVSDGILAELFIKFYCLMLT